MRARVAGKTGIIVGAGILLGLVGIGLVHARSTDVPPQAIADCFSAGTAKYSNLESCLQGTIGASLLTHSTGDLMGYIIASSSPAVVTQNCHEIAHVIGEQTYKKVSNLQDALGECTNECNYGCVHGV